MSVPRTVVDDATRNALLGLAVGDADILREAVDLREAEQQSSGRIRSPSASSRSPR